MQWLIDIVLEAVAALGYLTTSFVDRGDPASPDHNLGDFTRDFNWYDLDLSGIVPAGATAVLLNIYLRASTAVAYIDFRKDGKSNTWAISSISTQVANIYISTDCVVALPSSRIIEYSASPGIDISLNLTVGGWWL